MKVISAAQASRRVKECFICQAANVWGKGRTAVDAKINCIKANAGKSIKFYVVYLIASKQWFDYGDVWIDDDGNTVYPCHAARTRYEVKL